MQKFLIETSFNILHILITLNFLVEFNGYMNKSNRNKYSFFTFFILLVTAISIGDMITIFSEFAVLVVLLLILLFTFLYLKGSTSKKMISCFLIIFGHIVINTLCLFIGSLLFNRTIRDIIENFTIYRICIAYTAMLVLFIYSKLILAFTTLSFKNVSAKLWVTILLIPFISIFTLAMIMESVIYSSVNNKTFLYLLISAIGIIIVNIIVFVLFFRLSKEYENKTEVAILQKQLEHNTEIKDLYTQVQTIRHDFKNNLIYIQDCIAQENYSSLEGFIAKLNDDMINTKKFVITNSNILNSIINTKITQAFDNKINITYSIPDTLPPSINELDLSVILGNLLDNAIKACEEVPVNKKINLDISQDANGLHVEVSNTINESILSVNPNLKSSKPDQKNHGFGIKSVKNLVKKNNGIIDIYENESCTSFYVHIYFSIN
ncbi:sensor histidine kinase [Anaerotignum propionicum]|uniref:sensor histidine kinase n=1 Tax=Anaerotignum propionicum TaxID=28446 RepID=UPI00210DDB9D|nr:sensor histidine kinase [Anaerotignum propionicum]MCQ4935537.1 GHKL domain-containing protein [Anaerotignum propionicum]